MAVVCSDVCKGVIFPFNTNMKVAKSGHSYVGGLSYSVHTRKVAYFFSDTFFLCRVVWSAHHQCRLFKLYTFLRNSNIRSGKISGQEL